MESEKVKNVWRVEFWCDDGEGKAKKQAKDI